MTEEGQPSAAEKQRAAFAGLILFVRQIALQLLEQGLADEARGIIDGLEALDARTKGNADADEAKMLEEILFELRMAALKTPSGGEKGKEEG